MTSATPHDDPQPQTSQRRASRLPTVRYGFVGVACATFWQVTAMVFANDVPPGHGHNSGALPVEAWAFLAEPDGWPRDRTATRTAVIAQDQQ